MKSLTLLLLLLQGDGSTMLYKNPIHKISCTEVSYGAGKKLYNIYGQDSRYTYIMHNITLYSGGDVLGFMDDVTEFVQAGGKGDFATIHGYVIKINYKSKSFTISDKQGYGYKMFPTKTWLKMRKKIKDAIS